jgi:hypothetical protein
MWHNVNVNFEAMREEILKILDNYHVELQEAEGITEELLNLHLVMLSEQEEDILKTYNDPLLKQYSKQVDRDTYKTNSLNVIRKLKDRLHSA